MYYSCFMTSNYLMCHSEKDFHWLCSVSAEESRKNTTNIIFNYQLILKYTHYYFFLNSKIM